MQGRKEDEGNHSSVRVGTAVPTDSDFYHSLLELRCHQRNPSQAEPVLQGHLLSGLTGQEEEAC